MELASSSGAGRQEAGALHLCRARRIKDRPYLRIPAPSSGFLVLACRLSSSRRPHLPPTHPPRTHHAPGVYPYPLPRHPNLIAIVRLLAINIIATTPSSSRCARCCHSRDPELSRLRLVSSLVTVPCGLVLHFAAKHRRYLISRILYHCHYSTKLQYYCLVLLCCTHHLMHLSSSPRLHSALFCCVFVLVQSSRFPVGVPSLAISHHRLAST